MATEKAMITYDSYWVRLTPEEESDAYFDIGRLSAEVACEDRAGAEVLPGPPSRFEAEGFGGIVYGVYRYPVIIIQDQTRSEA